MASTVHRPLNNQDGVPNQPADTVETSVETSVDFDDPILGIKDIEQDFWLYASQTGSRALDSVGGILAPSFLATQHSP